MSELLHPGWWFSYFREAFPWWLFCFLASVVALPLCLRIFRGMADRGGGLACGVGLNLINSMTWVTSLEWLGGDRKASFVRILLVAGGFGLLALGGLFSARRYLPEKARRTVFVPGVLMLLLGILPLPHGAFSAWISFLLVGCASAACWLHDVPGLRRELRRVAVPVAASQIIFFIAFLFFVNVRSYIPWATFELSLYEAEKWGNYTHLQSAMTTLHMPPRDIWLHGEPTNYYYGGHLLVATIAKATGTPVREAFNFGLATIFALTMAMGFSFMLSLAHLTTRKMRLIGPVIWHHGMAWGVFGALAIGMFGNLDSWRQILSRDMDWGVQSRWERHQREAQEAWKIETGIPVAAAAAVSAAATFGDYYGRPDATLNAIKRAETETLPAAGKLKELSRRSDEIVKSAKGKAEDQLTNLLFGPEGDAALRAQNAATFDVARDHIYDLMVAKKFDEVPKYLDTLASREQDVAPKFERAETALSKAIQKATDDSSIRSVLKYLQTEEADDLTTGLLSIPRKDAEFKLEAAIKQKSFPEIGKVLSDFQQSINAGRTSIKPGDEDFVANVHRGLAALAINPGAIVEQEWGAFPSFQKNTPTIDDLRFTWENDSFIDFWQPSRAIKGAPAGVMEPGTITEFPYFSAILGDLHPHHMAIPFTLAALGACLSLLRKNSRLRSSEKQFWWRSWQELAAMAYFIAAVFPVNIWDAVVLAPLYAIVILTARRKVEPCPTWKWVGFAGFIVVLAIAACVPWNSVPGAAPLFQNFKGFLLATLILVPGIPILIWIMPGIRKGKIVAACLAAALLIVAVAGYAAPGGGGTIHHRPIAVSFRDLLIFAGVAGFAAMWALRNARAKSYWWYSAGAIYAMVGGAALFMILPFKLWFLTPLTPEKKLLFDMMPPFLSYDLTSAPGSFWEAFWDAVPINPFPQELRTELRDYIEHWGIFLLPIVIFAVSRYFRAARAKPAGFTFMITMVVLAVVGFARDYLGFWAGPLSLGMMILSFYYAMEFRRRAEGPMWLFLSAAFFWTWFVEALHFDDDYSGNYERYNTPFKIYYPIWALFAGGMVVAVKEGLSRFRFRDRTPLELLMSPDLYVFATLLGVVVTLLLQRILPRPLALGWFYAVWIPCIGVMVLCTLSLTSRKPGRFTSAVASEMSRVISSWPALVAAALLLLLGMHYPVAATATRTREFFTWPMAGLPESRQPFRQIFMRRTLDAIEHYSQYPQYRDDYQAMTWLEKNVPKNTMILERAGEDPYSSVGRMSTGSGLPTVVGWGHHEHQWRGRSGPAPLPMKLAYQKELKNLQDLGSLFTAILSRAQEKTTGDLQLKLRLADDAARIKILNDAFPGTSLLQLYRLRRIVQQQDINMQLVMDAMFRHVEEMYTSKDKDRARDLFARYRIQYVVVGDLERKKYGATTDERFRNWKFEQVFQSANDADADTTAGSTLIFKTPGDFARAAETR